MRVLCIAPHADDEIIGAGGYMAKLAKSGHDVFVLILSDKSERHDYDPKFSKFLHACARKANKIIGVKDVFFSHLKEDRLDQSLSEVIVPIEMHIAMLRPSLVLMPHKGDVNQDHRAAFEAGIVATRTLGNWEDKYPEEELVGPVSSYMNHDRSARRYNVQKVMSYEVHSTTEQAPPGWGFDPNVFVDITDTLSLKLRAMACYTSEVEKFPFPRSLEGIKVAAKFRGMACSFDAAEAFVLKREIIFSSCEKKKE